MSNIGIIGYEVSMLRMDNSTLGYYLLLSLLGVEYCRPAREIPYGFSDCAYNSKIFGSNPTTAKKVKDYIIVSIVQSYGELIGSMMADKTTMSNYQDPLF